MLGSDVGRCQPGVGPTWVQGGWCARVGPFAGLVTSCAAGSAWNPRAPGAEGPARRATPRPDAKPSTGLEGQPSTVGSLAGVRIGQLAARTAIPVRTIRFYEQAGLLPAPRRTPGGYRAYSEDAITRLRFVRSARA